MNEVKKIGDIKGYCRANLARAELTLKDKIRLRREHEGRAAHYDNQCDDLRLIVQGLRDALSDDGPGANVEEEDNIDAPIYPIPPDMPEGGNIPSSTPDDGEMNDE